MSLLTETTSHTLKHFSIILTFLFLTLVAKAQNNIGGDALNSYYSVSAVATSSVTCAGENLSDLNPGDKVLLIQMTGGEFYFLDEIDDANANPNSGGIGKYELLSVLSSNNSTKQVTFTANLVNISFYDPSDKIQLVKIYEAPSATVTSEISTPAWDGDKGGILALVITGKLTFNEDINLAGKGFRGGGLLNYDEGCRLDTPTDTMYFLNSEIDKGGEKGEGGLSSSFNYTIGPGNNYLGGGGGRGRFGGGGGGSNYRRGGDGGPQICSSSIPVAKGGASLAAGYIDYDRIFFGGGGGSSSQDATHFATQGGNGGGLVFILADTLVGNNRTISVSGESVSESAGAGGGGGGAAGSVLFDVETIQGNIVIDIEGGNGGDVIDDVNCSGAGGGGAGGVYWHSKGSLPGSTSVSSDGGAHGVNPCGTSHEGVGLDGEVIDDLQLILNGFTFNAISPSTDTLCINQTPNKITGTTPKGDNPSYQWYSSLNNSTWTIISGETEKDFQPPALTQTTYYTRDVTLPAEGITDRAISVTIWVYPDIADNELTLRDTVCAGTVPGLLSANSVSGGNGKSYEYYWQSSANQISWADRGDETTEELNETNALLNHTYYRRIVTSGYQTVCVDTSAVDTISVLSVISNNSIENNPLDTTICAGLDGGIIIASQPSGGEAGDYRYQWLRSTDAITYNSIGGASDMHYSPGVLATTNYYKRIVLSGEGNACADTTTDTREIEVLPQITGNAITSDNVLYCSGDTQSELKQDPGFTLGGGAGVGNYSYQWQKYSGSDWDDIPSASTENYIPVSLNDSSTYRRVVSSGLIAGALYACVDESSALDIDVIPEIENSIQTNYDNICQGSQPVAFTENPATGGAGGYSYSWEQNIDNSVWELAAGTNNQVSYAAPVLYASTQYRRLVNSTICSQLSDTISITVYDSIQNNIIEGDALQYTCYNSPAELDGSDPQGGLNNTYSYNWQSSEDDAIWSDEGGDRDFESLGLLVPTYFRRVVESGEAGQCENTSASVLVELYTLPTGDIVSGLDTICSDGQITIDYQNLSGNGPWTFILGDQDELETQSVSSGPTGTLNPFNLTETANIKVLSVQDNNGCFADTLLNTGRYLATVYRMPEADAGEDFDNCELTANLKAIPSTSDQAGVGLWSSPDIESINDETSPTAQVTVSDYNESIFTWTETNWKCVDDAQVRITFQEQPVEVDAGEDQVLNYKFETKLEANDPDVADAIGSWESFSGGVVFENETMPTTVVTMDDLGDYLLKWTIINGVCPAISDSIKVTIKDLELSNGFSPNGDGVNELFEVEIPSGNPVKLTIFDRNGNTVSVINGSILITWDGSNEGGKQVPADTYYYILEETKADGSKKSTPGFIEIRR